MFGGFGAEIEADSATKSSSSSIWSARLKRRSKPIVEDAFELMRLAAERAGDMAREDLDAVRKLEQPAQRVEEPFRALLRADREVRAGGVADEERVAGEHEPGLVGARAVDDGEARVLGPVPRRVDRAQDDAAELQLGAVLERVVGYSASAAGWIETGMPCSSASRPWPERWSACVCVSIDAHDLDARGAGGLLQHRLDREGRIDDRSDACVLVADQIRRTAEVVVQKLLEQHESDAISSVRRRARRSKTSASASAASTCRRRRRPSGKRTRSGAGRDVRLSHRPRRPRRRAYDGPQDATAPAQAAASARTRTLQSGLRPLRALKPGRQDLDPGALDLDPLAARGPGRSLRQLDPDVWVITPCSTRRGCGRRHARHAPVGPSRVRSKRR